MERTEPGTLSARNQCVDSRKMRHCSIAKPPQLPHEDDEKGEEADTLGSLPGGMPVEPPVMREVLLGPWLPVSRLSSS
jgi:hypothetical protein